MPCLYPRNIKGRGQRFPPAVIQDNVVNIGYCCVPTVRMVGVGLSQGTMQQSILIISTSRVNQREILYLQDYSIVDATAMLICQHEIYLARVSIYMYIYIYIYV